jgi:beta-lactamase superfamily II metal-dependent hydrolase
MKKAFVIVLIGFMLLFGCAGLGGQEQTTQTPSGTGTKPVTNQTGPAVVVVSVTNTTAIHNETLLPKPPETKILNYTYDPNATLTVYFVAVADSGQGDAIVLKKGDVNVLVDAGPAEDAGKLRDFLKSKNIGQFHLAVSTHGDPEHYSGFKYIVDNYDIGEFWWMGNSYNNKDYEALIGNAATKKIPVSIVSKSTSTTINGMKIEVINPTKLGGAFSGTEGMDNDAVVLKVTDRNFCIMLTSDILYGAQTAMQNDPSISLPCQVLQIPHHGTGAGNSQIELFLRKVNPKWAVISGGAVDPASDNMGTRFGVYQRLNLVNAKWLANYDGLGTVKVVTDGKDFAVQHDTTQPAQ